jgi:carbon starvation protein
MGFFAAARDLAEKLAAGVLPPERAAVASKLIFNQHLDGWLTVLFLLVVWIVVIDMARGCLQHLSGRRPASSTESPYVATQLT